MNDVIRAVVTLVVVFETLLCISAAVKLGADAWPTSKHATLAWTGCAAINLAWLGLMVYCGR